MVRPKTNMAIQHLKITNFRNLQQVNFQPVVSGLNIISGMNGSGKTSLLEAIYFLSHNRSFRAASANKLIQHQQEKFALFAQVVGDEKLNIPVGMERSTVSDTKIRMDYQETRSVTDIAKFIPVRLINSQSYYIFESGPAYRRKFLDWGLFYHSPTFLETWRQFMRALKQRNILLREQHPLPELAPWTQALVRYGHEIDQQRKEYVALLLPLVQKYVQALLNVTTVDFNYLSGWNDSGSWIDQLINNFTLERRLGYTLLGPHRADLSIAINGIPVRHVLSRGQQKLLICAMMLAQGFLLAKLLKKEVIYLIDDLPAELDFPNRQKLLAMLIKQQAQVFLTAIDAQIFAETIEENDTSPKQLFHVEHGVVTAQSI